MKKNLFIALLSCFALLPAVTSCAPEGIVIRPAPADRQLREAVLPESDKGWVKDKIAVIDVDGILINASRSSFLNDGENPVSLFLEKLSRAAEDDHVKAVVLRINSPGGTVAGSEAMYHALREFRHKSAKPVVVSFLDLAASGAYYLACGADHIMAQPATVTGSIGTIMHTVSFAGTLEKIGVKTATIKSGRMKDMGSVFHDLSGAEQEVFQGIIDDFYQGFLNVVLDGRKSLSREKLEKLADGRVFTADQALEAGLIDRLGYPQDAVAWAKELAGVDSAKVIMYHRPLESRPNLYATADARSAQPAALVNIELPNWLQSQGPQFLYLWPGYLQ